MASRRRQVSIVVKAVDQASAVLATVGGSLKGLGAIAAAVGGIAIGRVLVGGLAKAVRVAADFHQAMADVRAITGAGGQAFVDLTEKARELGSSTAFTAGQAAEAMEKFAKAGFRVNEILKATGPALNLAVAGELSLADAASITADTLRGMGLEIDQVNRVMDVLGKTATSSNQAIQDIGEAMKFVAPAAQGAGFEIEEVGAALAVLANNGLRASIAGTGLRKTITTLFGELDEGAEGLAGLNIELTDSEGNMKSLAEVMDELAEAGVNAFNAYRLFGERAGGTVKVLIENRDLLRENVDALQRAGGELERIATTKLATFSGALIQLNSAWDNFRITLGSLITESPAIRRILTELVDVINRMNHALRDTQGATLVKSLALSLLTLSSVAVKAGTGLANFTTFYIGLAKAAAAAKGIFLWGNTEQKAALKAAVAELAAMAERMQATHNAGAALAKEIAELRKEIEGLPDTVPDPEPYKEAAEGAGALRDAIEGVVAAQKDVVSAGQAVNRVLDEGLEVVQAQVASGQLRIRSLEEDITNTLGVSGVDSALAFGDALVDAAFAGELSFGEFFKGLLRDLSKAILKALLLQLILKGLGFVTGGASSAVAPAAGGGLPIGGGTFLLGSGGIVRGRPGMSPGVDKLVGRLDAGEGVLSARDTREVLEGGASIISKRAMKGILAGSGGGGIELHLHDVVDGRSFVRLFERFPGEAADGIRELVRRGYLAGV